MWKIYDTLIDGIDSNLKVSRAYRGSIRAAIESDGRCGISSLLTEKPLPEIKWGYIENYKNKPLKDIAALVKSWDNDKAAFGMAAINSYYNNTELIKLKNSNNEKIKFLDGDVFRRYLPQANGKKVAMVGHFRGIAEMYNPICDFKIFERDPRPGDLPDAAAEYLLPEMDIVFITGMTFTNKTLPRLLELSKNAKVIITGPSTALSPALFNFGVEALSGIIFKETQRCFDAVASNEWNKIYTCADKIIIT